MRVTLAVIFWKLAVRFLGYLKMGKSWRCQSLFGFYFTFQILTQIVYLLIRGYLCYANAYGRKKFTWYDQVATCWGCTLVIWTFF